MIDNNSSLFSVLNAADTWNPHCLNIKRNNTEQKRGNSLLNNKRNEQRKKGSTEVSIRCQKINEAGNEK